MTADDVMPIVGVIFLLAAVVNLAFWYRSERITTRSRSFAAKITSRGKFHETLR